MIGFARAFWVMACLGWIIGRTMAQPAIRIGLMEGQLPSQISISTEAGAFEWVLSDGTVHGPLKGVNQLEASSSTLLLDGHPASYFHLRPVLAESLVQLRAGKSYPSSHQGSLHFIVEGGRIRCILETDVDTYLQGVLSAESGKGHHPAYYAAQAIVSRTYTIQALGRHRMVGFDLCDAVHCQAYHGLGSINDTLASAVANTHDQVLVDRKGAPITAAFHSNCGGHTQGAENVWQRPLDYLVGVPDTFCLAMPHAQWTKTVNSEEWRSWLDVQRATTSNRTTFLPTERFDVLPDSGGHAVRAVDARAKFGLQSSFFVTVDDGDRVRFMGQGFGHGVGLCQEGAMERARSGQSFGDILHHYYSGVRIASLGSLLLFQED